VDVAKTVSRVVGKGARVCLAVAALALGVPDTARAQDGPNTGSIAFTGGLDLLPNTTYVFRGIVQEADSKLTLWPYGDLGLTLFESDGGIESVSLNIGVWNSLHSGSSGLDGPSDRLHYEEDFYASLGFGLANGLTLAATYTAYTSPNSSFGTVQELSFKVTSAQMLAPYGLLAFELDGAADGGSSGTYLELGVGPSFALTAAEDGPTVTIPVKLGLSLNDYYEGPTGDEAFGFFDIGALITMPIKAISPAYGSWNFHAGADLLLFGDTTKAFNNGDGSKLVGLIGIGLSY
jgi:hypothetical protein